MCISVRRFRGRRRRTSGCSTCLTVLLLLLLCFCSSSRAGSKSKRTLHILIAVITAYQMVKSLDRSVSISWIVVQLCANQFSVTNDHKGTQRERGTENVKKLGSTCQQPTLCLMMMFTHTAIKANQLHSEMMRHFSAAVCQIWVHCCLHGFIAFKYLRAEAFESPSRTGRIPYRSNAATEYTRQGTVCSNRSPGSSSVGFWIISSYWP